MKSRRLRSFVIFVVLLAVLTACSSPAAAPGAAVEVTREVRVTVPVTVPVEVTREVPVTVEVEVTRLVEVTPDVTATPAVTNTPAAAAADERPMVVHRENVELDLGGVKVMLDGAALFDWQAAQIMGPSQEWIETVKDDRAFEDTQVLGSLTLTITNTTDSKINIYADQGTVVVGSEQVDLSDYMMYSDDMGGTLFPGVVKSGTLVFTLKQTAWDEVANGARLVFELNAPTNEKYDSLADQPYRFEVELVNEKE